MYLSPQQRYALGETVERQNTHARRDLLPSKRASAFVGRESPLMDGDNDCFEAVIEPTSPQELDDDDSLRGIEILRSEDEETSTPKIRQKELSSSPGILLPPKRAIAQKDHHERHVRFSPPSPKVQKPVGFFEKLESVLSKMQLVCGSMNQVSEEEYASSTHARGF